VLKARQLALARSPAGVSRARVQVKIYDVEGRLVRALVDAVQEPSADGYVAVWDGKDDRGRRAGSGLYLYQISAPDFSASRKLVLLK
jgi:flagellar hook assembly protein FlgD